jgi:deoxyribodipyrimidine photo-lyase
MIQKERIKALNENAIRKGKYVLYWMQASQRTEYNHALEYAILKANEYHQPIVVFFGITDHFPEGNERHYSFMLEGLREAKRSLEKRGIRMVIQHRSPEIGIVPIAKEASLVVVDRGYLRIQKAWRNDAAQRLKCPLIQVESDVIVPVEEASPKEEYAAATLRPKIHKKLNHFFIPLKENDPVTDSPSLDLNSFDLEDIERAILRLRIDRSVKGVHDLHGGTEEAKKHLQVFLEKKLDDYAELRNDPSLDLLSKMSPYLHFGQISPLYIALKVLETKSPGQEAYLEELIVRRELGMNLVFYNPQYDSIDAIPEWARKSLKAHQKDKRQYLYTLEELETSKTHDPYWNAGQKEMVIKGKMHGYMRM